MSGVNKVIIVGYMGSDPEVRTLPNGDVVATISVATSEKWTKDNGEKVERTEWHRIQFWGKQAEVIAQYAKKGTQIYVEGSLHTRKWQDKNGIDRYTTEIKCSSFQFLGGYGEQGEKQGQAQEQQPTQEQQGQQGQDPDEVPF